MIKRTTSYPLRPSRRRLLAGAAATVGLTPIAHHALAMAEQDMVYDLIVIGAGTAGMPAAIFAADRGASVLLLDAAPIIGGTLAIAGGEICGAGTKTQERFGVTGDHPDIHFDDVMRMSNGLADPNVVRLTVDNAPAMIDWIDDRGWDCSDAHIIDGASEGRPGYSVKRYYQDKGMGKAIADLFIREVENRAAVPTAPGGRITVLTGTRALELLTSDAGTVEGVRAQTNGMTATYRGHHVLVTSGGYPANPWLFEQYVGAPMYINESYAYCTGGGLVMAERIGAALRGHNLHRPGSGSILTSDTYPATVYARFDTRPQKRMPWEIWVNNNGERFVNEETPNRSAREQALMEQPGLRYAIVFDQAILDTAPPGIPGWTRDDMAAHFNTHMMFKTADTLEDLARMLKVNPAGLASTVAAFNAGIEAGSDPLARAHRPLPIAQGPFYGIIHLGHSATSSVGITVNADLQAVRADGTPIPNLYAAGEALGSGATLGNAFVPGMMITPAMTLGRLLGERLAIA
jgi:fumarate reductase flavoprotein subunit